jgi:hypothetical protein
VRVVAVDPGLVTGYAVYDTEAPEIITGGEIFGHFRGCVDYILGLGDFFVIEDFRVRPRAARGLAKQPILWPVEWLGVFRYKLTASQWSTQTPADRKGVPTPTEGATRHENDARAHLLRWLQKNHLSPKSTFEEAVLAHLSTTQVQLQR